MPNLTENYGLKKPLANEYAKPDDFNYNADAVDAALHSLETGKATPQDIATALANKVTPIQIYNITSANYADNKYEIELPYDKCYFIFTQDILYYSRNKYKVFGVICKTTNQIMNMGTNSTYGASNYSDQSVPFVVDIGTNRFMVSITIEGNDNGHRVVYIAQVIDGKLKFGTGNVITPNGVTENVTGTLALMQI